MAKNICSGTPFINVTFTELLWGYYDSMPCVNLNRPSDCPAPPEEVFTLITIITVLIITITTILIKAVHVPPTLESRQTTGTGTCQLESTGGFNVIIIITRHMPPEGCIVGW